MFFQTGLILVLTTFLTPADSAEALHRCIDLDGRTYYSDRPGPECEAGQHDRLTRQGIVLDRPLVDTSPQSGETEEQRQQRVAQELRDRALFDTYASEKEIEAAKQRSLQTHALAMKFARQKLEKARERLANEREREAKLASTNTPVPESLRFDISTSQSEVARLERDVDAKQRSIDRIINRYESDKERWRKLQSRMQEKK